MEEKKEEKEGMESGGATTLAAAILRRHCHTSVLEREKNTVRKRKGVSLSSPCIEIKIRKPAGSRFGLIGRFAAGSTIQGRFINRRFWEVNRTVYLNGSRFNRFDRPVRTDFQNYDINI
ncbi:hypothetical protein PIB30_022184 [Stylosanthes scabra]|uniref:Uncharacterized protein n=1 Tax=Stylosanthes scabra TaxID=79078 RepID=A0ABU6WAZ5_9FABA|nr:hypothetical protein [Stylosanthes scabra]